MFMATACKGNADQRLAALLHLKRLHTGPHPFSLQGGIGK
jgi:hypothetical protein